MTTFALQSNHHRVGRSLFPWRSRKTRRASREPRRRRHHVPAFEYQQLESRELLAFSGTVSGATTILTQTALHGAVTIANNGAGNTWQVTDGSGAVNFPISTHLQVNLLPGNDMVAVNVAKAHAGDMRINLNDGDRPLVFSGANNSIGGLVRIDGGKGNQSVDLAGTAALNVGGDVIVSLGNGVNDSLLNGLHSWTIGGALRLFGVNSFSQTAPVQVGGYFIVNSQADTAPTSVNLGGKFQVGGGLIYDGGIGVDKISHVTTSPNPMTVMGPVSIDLGGVVGSTDAQIVILDDIHFHASLTIKSSNTNSQDVVQTSLSSSSQDDVFLDGNVLVDLGGGSNIASFLGRFSGTDVDFRGGIDSDVVFYGFFGAPADVNFVMSDGTDHVTISEDVPSGFVPIAIGQLRVDYGDNSSTDRFEYDTNRLLDVTLLNYQGFDVFQSKSLNQLNVVETVAHPGGLWLGTWENGKAVFFEILAGSLPTLMAEVANLRLTALANSGDIEFVTQSPLEGFAIINARQGARNIRIGANQAGGFEIQTLVGDVVRIDASGGDQNVILPSRIVADRLAVNLRDGNDQVIFASTEGPPSFLGDMIFRGVNTVSQGPSAEVAVFGNAVINTRFFVESSKFLNTASMFVQGKFTYLGGDGPDIVKLGEFQAGEVYVDLGKNIFVSGAQEFRVTGDVQVGFFPYSTGNFFVKAGNAPLNIVDLSGMPIIRGYASVDVSKNTTGQNAGAFDGTYYDRFVYLGGPVKDTLTMLGATLYGAPFQVYLGAGADQFDLQKTVNYSLDELFIDFGAGVDTFIDGFSGSYPFILTTVNLP